LTNFQLENELMVALPIINL